MTETAKAVEATDAEKGKKSIVPAKYSGKYKGAGDSLSEFIKSQTEGVSASLLALCRANGIDEAKVAKYEGLLADKENNHGIEGRARMTLGNMLRAKARKEGKLVNLAGDEVEFNDLAKPAVSGAAAKAQEAAAENAATEIQETGDGEPDAETSADETTE